jgi:omega-amidase
MSSKFFAKDQHMRNVVSEERISASCLQFNVIFKNVERNLASALAGLERVARKGGRLAVLPEMWSGGFDYPDLAELANKTPQVLQALADFSASHDIVIVGSLPEGDDRGFYNTAYLLDRGDIIGSYRKLHLFSPMREDRYLQPGNTTLIADTSAGRIGVAICYDLRFPELFRKLTLDGADLICLSAQWPKPRQAAWRTLLQARAIENQIFMVAANCCGPQGKLDFFGMSLIISPRGEILAEAGGGPEEILASLDFADMADYRSNIPALRDRRPDVYGP